MPAKKKSPNNYPFHPLFVVSVLVIAALVIGIFASYRSRHEVTIALVAELSGEMSAVGQSSLNGAKLAVQQLNEVGGVEVDGTQYKINLLVKDNESSPQKSSELVNQLAGQRNVLAIVGPNASAFAIPAALAAEQKQLLLISPWSTDPATTMNGAGGPQYVFRATFTTPIEMQTMAQYVANDLKKTKVAVLYDPSTAVLNGEAQDFIRFFTATGGKVSAQETFNTGDKDFSTQLKKIRAARPDVLFLPSYYGDVANQVKQARALGITVPIISSDAAFNAQLLDLCGSSCDGLVFPADYSPSNVNNGVTASFIAAYQKQYNQSPDDVAALTYDSVGVVAQALSQAKVLTREALQQQMIKLPLFEGVTGKISYDQSGDPIKDVTLLQVKKGKFVWLKDVANPGI